MKLSLHLIILFINIIFCCAEVQQNGWENVFANNLPVIPLHHFEEKSYYFGTHIKLSYLESFQFCRNIHMNLVSIKSKEENDRIFQYINNIGKGYEYWTAGARFLDDQHWIWMSTGEPVEYSNWHTHKHSFGVEHCLQLLLKKDNEIVWNNRDCHSRLSFICERNDYENEQNSRLLKPSSKSNWGNWNQNPSSLSANIHLLQGEGKQYFFARHLRVNFHEASQICQTINMQLVAIESEEENKMLHKYIRDTAAGLDFWSGGVRFLDGIRWIWLPTGETVQYTNWKIGEPKPRYEHCLSLHYVSERGLFWYATNCELHFNFICEKRTNNEEEEEVVGFIEPRRRNKRSQLEVLHVQTSGSKLDIWRPFGLRNVTKKTEVKEETETRLYINFTSKLRRDEAYEHCKSRKMHLIEISDENKNNRVKTVIQQSGLPGPFWTAGSKVSAGNTTKPPISYTNWDSNIVHAEHNCLVIQTNGKWNRAPCSNKHYVICEWYPNDEPIMHGRILTPTTNQPSDSEPPLPTINIPKKQEFFISDEQLEKLIQRVAPVQPPVVNVYVNNVVQTKVSKKIDSSDVFTSKNVTKSENGYNVLVNNNIDSNGKCTVSDDDIIPFFGERINE